MDSTTNHRSMWLRHHPQRRTAIHEAGHAALAVIEGRTFDDILLKKTGNSNAILRNLSYFPGDDDVVRILVAGIMAARLARHRWDCFLFDSAHDDLGAVAEFIKNHTDPESLLQWNVTATDKCLLENWGSVENIAAILIRNRLVTYQEAIRLFEEGKKEGIKSRPFGKMGARGWCPLYARVKWRIRYPNGLRDLLNETEMQLRGENSKAGESR